MGNPYSDISALDLLKEEMTSDETYIKVNSIHRLKIICTVLGSDSTVSFQGFIHTAAAETLLHLAYEECFNYTNLGKFCFPQLWI